MPLFAAWKLDDSRRKVDGVGKFNTTDLRSACEYALKERISEGGHKHYLLHQHEVSLRHYQAGGVEKGQKDECEKSRFQVAVASGSVHRTVGNIRKPPRDPGQG